MSDFQLTNQYLGYATKPDATNLAPGYLVSGSQNVITNEGEQVSARRGYSLFGAAASGTAYPIISSYEWETNRGVEHALRRYNDTLQVAYSSAWYTLKTGLATASVNLVNSNFAEFWSTTDKIDFLLFTDGTDYLFDWTGAVGVFASATVNTVTKSGTETWAEAGFLLSGTRKIVIGGVEATYTGGEGTTTLTGVSVDFSATAVGTPVFQGVRSTQVSTFSDTNTSIPNDFKVDLISVLNNQVYIGNIKSRNVFVSKVNSYTDYGKGIPRVTGEGEILTLDAPPVGFKVGDSGDVQVMNISAGKNFWYVVLFAPSSDLTNEAVQVRRLKTQPQKGALSQAAIANVINDIVFVSHEPTFDSLGRVEQINNTPQTSALSEMIRRDFNELDFTNCHVRYHKNNIYISVPTENLVYIRNLAKGYWEPPQLLPVRRFAVINGDLYGHSSISQETYKLFDGYTDNGNPYKAVAVFAYNNSGVRDRQKSFTEHFQEGYIGSATTLTLTLNYDYQGYTQVLERDISGSDTAIIFGSSSDDSLGTASLGTEPLGGGSGDLDPFTDIPKFRAIRTFPRADYFEYQATYSSEGESQVWSILSYGPAAKVSEASPVSIKD